MADLKLKRIVLRNWMKFRRADITFPEKGLVLVQGVNTASGGALSSVGSGKTGFGEAICRALLGVTGRFNAIKQFSADKQGDTYIKLEAELRGKTLVVESGYACAEMSSTGEALRYTYDGKTYERGKIQQTRADLAALLGVPQLLAEWTVFIDGEKLRFNRLGQAECVELVMSALQQPPWDQFFEASKAKSGNLSREIMRDEADHAKALKDIERSQAELSEATDALSLAEGAYHRAKVSHQERITTQQAKIKKQRVYMGKIQEEMQQIKATLKELEDERAKRTHELEIQMHEVEDKIHKNSQERRPLQEAQMAAMQVLTQAKSDHSNYKKSADKCPTCQRAMGELDPHRLENLAKAMEQAKKAYDKASAANDSAESKSEELEIKRRQLAQQLREVSGRTKVTALSTKYSDLEESLEDSREWLVDHERELAGMQTGPSDKAVVEAKVWVKSCKQQLSLREDALKKAAETLTQDKATAAIVNYWYQAFSPYGIPNMVLGEAIGPLNHEARRVSAAMTGGTIEVRFNTTRELASGKSKAQLNIEVDNKLGDKDLAGSSKGESGLANFIIAETLSEVGQVSKRIGFRWYDEILPHQDPKVCQSIYSYMKDVAERLGVLVFLVDHNPVAANYADHVLLVEKQNVRATGPDEDEGVYSTVSWR